MANLNIQQVVAVPASKYNIPRVLLVDATGYPVSSGGLVEDPADPGTFIVGGTS
jgi:hypothetical protein